MSNIAKRELKDGTELIWTNVSFKKYRWNPKKAVLLGRYEKEFGAGEFKTVTRFDLFLAEYGSIVEELTSYEGEDLLVEYFVSAEDSQDAINALLSCELRDGLNKRGVEILEEYASSLDLV